MTEGKHLSFVQFPLLFKSKDFLDTGTHGDMEEGILEIQPCTQSAFLQPFPDHFNVFHVEINMTNVFVEFLQIEDRSPLVRTPFRFWYCKV